MPREVPCTAEVCKVMPSATLAPLLPMENPLIVIVNADNGPMDAPEIVIITAVADVGLNVASRPDTLLATILRLTPGTKKLEG
jgi:hypothetical protein